MFQFFFTEMHFFYLSPIFNLHLLNKFCIPFLKKII